MHPFIGISMEGGGGHVSFISTSMRGVGAGVVYDLNIESKINLAGNANNKNMFYRLLEILVHVTKMCRSPS